LESRTRKISWMICARG